jgi:hypothetical protein
MAKKKKTKKTAKRVGRPPKKATDVPALAAMSGKRGPTNMTKALMAELAVKLAPAEKRKPGRPKKEAGEKLTPGQRLQRYIAANPEDETVLEWRKNAEEAVAAEVMAKKYLLDARALEKKLKTLAQLAS